MSHPDDDRNTAPDFGPSGYLPERASKRARKIVLRAPMGMHWIWGAIAVGVGVLVVGAIFLATRGGPPGAPYIEFGPVEDLDSGHFTQLRHPGIDLVPEPPESDYLSMHTGRIRLFHVDDWSMRWCPESLQFEGDTGTWTATGRGRGGAPSLAEHPTVIVDGILYWDPSATIPGPFPDPESERRLC